MAKTNPKGWTQHIHKRIRQDDQGYPRYWRPRRSGRWQWKAPEREGARD